MNVIYISGVPWRFLYTYGIQITCANAQVHTQCMYEIML